MNSIIIRLADLNIQIKYKYDFFKEMCKDYVFDTKDIDFCVEAKSSDLEKYSKQANEEYGEFLAIYESIASKLADYNRVLIHGAAISYNNKAYLFLGPSGIGKSTHIKLWKDNIDGVTIINGDKPIIDTNGYIYGTPWAGKENWNSNIKCKINGVVLLHQAKTNSIKKINKSEHLDELLNQIYRNNNFEKSVSIFDKAIDNDPIYDLSCNIDIEAARICFETVTKDNRL